MKRRDFLATAGAVPAAMIPAGTIAADYVAGSKYAALSPTRDGPSTGDGSKPFIVKSGEARSGIHTPFKGINANDVKISGKDTNGQLAVFEYIGKEKTGPPLHVHHHQDEIFSIVEGEYLFKVGDEQFKATAGDTVFAPRGIPHTWVQLSDEGRQVYSVQPAGKLEEMFLRIHAFTAPPTEQQLQQAHEECGLKIVGPPLVVN